MGDILAGLRERKKAETRERIALVARKLFKKKGFEETLIEEIALLADVSEGTVYNYFPTKNDILFATFEADTAKLVVKIKAMAKSEILSFEASSVAILDTFFDLIGTLDRSALRQFAYTPSRPSEHYATQYGTLNAEYTASLVEIYSTLQQAGRLSKQVDVPALSRLIFNVADAELTKLMLSDNLAIKDAKLAIRGQIAIIAHGVDV
jgi:AcrR family transcriptional regulator